MRRKKLGEGEKGRVRRGGEGEGMDVHVGYAAELF